MVPNAAWTRSFWPPATKYVSAIDVVGRDGTEISTVWEDGAHAYLGVHHCRIFKSVHALWAEYRGGPAPG